MKNYQQFYINGQWVDPISDQKMEVINPSNEQVCAQISIGNEADLNNAVSAASEAFKSYAFSSREDRIEIIQNIIQQFKLRYNDIADAISEEMGAPTALAVKSQAGSGLAHFQAIADVLKDYAFEKKQGVSLIKHEAVGVCGLITPWNWPMNQLACKVAPALAAGCTLVLKPSEIAPLSAYIFSQVVDAAGLPAGIYNMLNGDGPGVGSALSSHPLVDMVSFTGSTRAGSLVAQNAAPTVKRVAQELGGKSANIILADADLEKAVTRGAREVFNNSGQSCNAPTRMLVPKELLAKAESIATAAANRVVVGEATDPATTMGPVISELQYNKIRGLIQTGIDEGAKLLCGGLDRPQGCDKGYFVAPTIFSQVNNQMTIAREEIFGPVLSILAYDSLDQAIEIANDTPYGLAGYIQGEDPKTLRYVADRIRAGNININGNSGDINTPFGGCKQSGNGREWGVHGLNDFVEIKAISGLN